MKYCLFTFLLLFIVFVIPAQCVLEEKISIDLSDTTLTVYASQSIEANSAITGAVKVQFQAGSEITFLPEFYATGGIELLAKIAPCPDSLYTIIANIPQNEGLTGKAKNIWDLQIYKGKLYLGYGSTTRNTGPTALWAYDLATETLATNCIIASEAIERFRVWNDTLFIPNSDPTSGDLPKFVYLAEEEVCQSISINYGMAHVRDLYFFNGQYYLVGNTRCPGSKEPNCAGLISLTNFSGNIDNTWLQSELVMADNFSNSRWNWFFGLLEVDGQLVLPNAMFTKAYNPNLAIKDNLFYQIEPNNELTWSAFQPPNKRLLHTHFFPVDTTQTEVTDTAGLFTSLRIFEHASFNNKTLYALRTYSMFNAYYQAQYNNSAGLVLKDSLRGAAKMVNFPATNAIGEDLKIINNELYVLANEKITTNSFKIYVYKTTAPTAEAASWTEVLQLDSKNMARSFEYANGFFYFGLGFNEGEEVQKAGQLIRVKE